MADIGEGQAVPETPENADTLWRSYHLNILLNNPLSHIRGSLAGLALDVGCGDGQSLWLMDRFGVPNLGVDIEPSCKPAVKGTALRLPFKDESFGIVVCLRTLQHIRDERAALREMRRVLMPGGHIVMAVANKRSFSMVSLKSRGEWSGRDRIPYEWFKPYSEKEVNELLLSEGFEIVESEVAGYAPELLRRRFPLLSRFALRAIMRVEKALESLPIIGPRGTHVTVVARLPMPNSSGSSQAP